MSRFKIKHEFRLIVPWRMIILFIFFMTVIIIGGYYFYKSQRTRIFDEQENDLAAIASLKMSQIEQWHSDLILKGSNLRNNILLINKFNQCIHHKDLQRTKTEAAQMLEVIFKEFHGCAATLVDTSLKTLFSVSLTDSIQVNFIKKDIIRAIRYNELIVTDLHRVVENKEDVIDLIIPLRNMQKDNRETLGAVLVRIDLRKTLFPIIESWPTENKSTETLIVTREGDSVVFLNNLRYLKNTSITLKLPVSNENLLASKAVRGTMGVVEGVDYRNVPVVGYVTKILDLPWYLVAKINKEELQRPLKRVFYFVLFTIALIGLINTGIFGFWLWEQKVQLYQKELQNELERKAIESHFEYLFKYANDMITLLDKDFKIVEANDKALNTYGYTREEMIGLDGFRLRSARGRLEVSEHLRSIEQKGSAFYEAINIRKDGSEFPVEVSARSIDIEGNKFYQFIARDITERNKTEEALRESERKYRKLITSLDIGIVLHAPDTSIILANPRASALLGLTIDQLKGKMSSDPDWKFLRDSDVPLRQEEYPVVRIINSRKPIKNMVVGLLRPLSKNVVWLLINGFPIYNNEGQISEICISFTDITELKIADTKIRKFNEELEQRILKRTEQLEFANRELESFSYSVSHDLRSPLRSLQGYTNILTEEYKNVLDDEGKRVCGIITKSATQMSVLIDDLLNFSRVGRSSLNPVLIEMKSLVGTVFDDITDKKEKAKITLEVDDLHNTTGDLTLIRLVWINLISNAIKYSSKEVSPVIKIKSEPNGDMIIYNIKDNGVGFDMKYKHKLFKVFQRLHNEKDFEGTGVGLALVQRIILKHYGRVWGKGEVGIGATFYFSLPANG